MGRADNEEKGRNPENFHIDCYGLLGNIIPSRPSSVNFSSSFLNRLLREYGRRDVQVCAARDVPDSQEWEKRVGGTETATGPHRRQVTDVH